MKTLKPHVHHDLIVKWAEGHTIEYEQTNGEWVIVDTPAWMEDGNYRVRKEIVYRLWEATNGCIYLVLQGGHVADTSRFFKRWITEWLVA